MGRSWGMLDRFADLNVISKFCRNSAEMIALSFGVIALRCDISGRDLCFLICLFLFPRYGYLLFLLFLFQRFAGCNDPRPSTRSSFSAFFGATCRSGSSAIQKRALFRGSDCCLIVLKCCICRNRHIRRP